MLGINDTSYNINSGVRFPVSSSKMCTGVHVVFQLQYNITSGYVLLLMLHIADRTAVLLQRENTVVLTGAMSDWNLHWFSLTPL